MMKSKKKEIIFDTSVCCFCNKPSDEKLFGKFFVSSTMGFAVHQYCMFFSAALPQNGSDDEGFEGFLERDIVAEVRRAKRLRCCVCRQTGASAGCCKEMCKKAFHFPCGQEKKFLFQYFGEFCAFCSEHRLYQNVPDMGASPKMVNCAICLEAVPCKSSPDFLTTPCCKDTWFHRLCVQEQAKTSGYFFRCAVCNDDKNFVTEMKRMGIYVPDRDAAWEEGENFAELLEKYSRCDSASCKCPHGAMYSEDSGRWELVLCSSCGQYGTHVGCRSWISSPPSFFCPTCLPVHEESDDAEVITLRPRRCPREQPVSLATADSGVNRFPEKTARKTSTRKKRAREESSDESDDISDVLNGLKRQASDGFPGLDLPTETQRVVQRALAAGTAFTEKTGQRSKSSSSRKGTCESKKIEYKSKHESKVGLTSSENSDDDCVITKYIPGCSICPKCKRRKPMISPSRLRASETPQRSSATSGVGSPSVATSTTTTTNTVFQGNADGRRLSRPPFVESLEPRGNATMSKPNGNRAVEVIEDAPRRASKSSVFLIPPVIEGSESSDMIPAEEKESKIQSKAETSQTVDDIVENVISQTKTSDSAVSLAGSFLSSSVKRIGQMLHCSTEARQKNSAIVSESSEAAWNQSKAVRVDHKAPEADRVRSETNEANNQADLVRHKSSHDAHETVGKRSLNSITKADAVTMLLELCEASEQVDKNKHQVVSKLSKSQLKDSSTKSSDGNHHSPNGDLNPNLVSEFPFSSSICNTETLMAGLSVTGCRPTGTKLEDEGASSKKAEPGKSNGPTTRLCFSRSDPEKTVLEAALDRGYELRSSGKEMTHHCLTSF